MQWQIMHGPASIASNISYKVTHVAKAQGVLEKKRARAWNENRQHWGASSLLEHIYSF